MSPAAGVFLEWEVFDWGRKKQEMNAKRHTASQARVAEEALDRRIRVEVAQALRQCAEAAQRVKVSTLSQRAAREGLREQQICLRPRGGAVERRSAITNESGGSG